MNRLLLLSVGIVLLGCSKPAEPTSTATSAAPPSSAAASATSAPAPAPAPATASAAPTPSAGALASQETNWNGIVAEVTEFRRKGNTLTAKVRFTNRGSEEPQPEIHYNEAYLIDTAAGKKYNVLKDEKDEYIAALNPSWHDRWFQRLKPGQSQLIWMKFPAPPPETKAITLQIPNTPPFEDIAIQE